MKHVYTHRERRLINTILSSPQFPVDMPALTRQLDRLGVELVGVTRVTLGDVHSQEFGTRRFIPIDEYRKEMQGKKNAQG